MKNYMFNRCPMLDQPTDAIAVPRRQKQGAGNVGRKGLISVVVFLVLIVGLTAAALVLNQLEGNPIFSSLFESGGYETIDPGFGVLPGLFDETAASLNKETSLPKAAIGDGTLLSITTARGDVMSAKEIYQKVQPSVVSILCYTGDSASGGSGVVMSGDGYIITNYHVIEGASEAWVQLLTDGSTYPAKLVGYYAEMDLAVLKIEAEGLTPAEFGSSRDLEVGEWTYAIGNPMGYLYGSMTFGIVSALDRTVSVNGYPMKLIQTDAALNSGNSGGALINEYGQVVGITVAKISQNSSVTTEALGLVIPISDARRCINSLLRTGEMENPAIGITCMPWQDGGGVLVVTVVEDGPAAQAGLLPEDVITTANGVAVSTVDELKDVLYDTGIGGALTCTILRNGSQKTLSFVLSESGT